MLLFQRMKTLILLALFWVPLWLWPAGESVSETQQFQNSSGVISEEDALASIARDTDSGDMAPSSMASFAPPAADMAESAAKPAEAEAESQAENEPQAEESPRETAQDKSPRAMSISESLRKEAAGEGDEEVGEEVIEWVGKDRRIKRIKKKPETIYLKSEKIPGKLIITDDYHQSNSEMLGTADVRHYGARPEESKWLYSGSKFQCELRHPIPGFGYAVMKKAIEEPLQFMLEADGLIGGSGRARIQSRPPIWKRFTLVKDLGVVDVEPKDKVLFSVSDGWAKRIIVEMQEGMQPTISLWDDDTGGSDVVLTVSSFNFQKHLPDFAQCLGNLLPYSFKDVRKRTVYFGYDKYQLSTEQQERLNKLIEYVKLDEEVKKIDITGYSDSVGFARYNKILAQRRANAVKKYLLAQGLPANKLTVRAEGEKGDKKFNNRTEAGRRKNRRVEVTLVK